MTALNLQAIFDELILLPAETEWVEFKEAKRNYDFNDLGEYFSALSNEANLKSKDCAWLIFGVSDKPPREIVGTSFRPSRPHLDSLKQETAKKANGMTFVEIYELTVDEKRVLMFQIPPALRGMPTSWDGHFFGRHGESLSPLNLTELEQIRSQTMREDWSAQVCDEAAIDDLDPNALAFARKQYKEKNPNLAAEIDSWDDMTFLNKSRVCIKGNITHAALLLLGKAESVHYLSPAQAQITWVLTDHEETKKDYHHFGPPFILSVGHVFDKIRNLTYRYMPDNTLFPSEFTTYDPWVIRETLHNCIAHQDYLLAGRINVVEETDSLLFTNVGSFIPGTVENVLLSKDLPSQYRNPCLAHAMVHFNMIDTIGSGIKRMFKAQRDRFFPMPDFDLSESNKVQVRLNGKILDENYTRLLMSNSTLDLMDVIALDKVQKRRQISEDEIKRLKTQKLIEGRRPNLYVSVKVATITGEKADYIKHRAFDKDHYEKMIISYLENFEEAKLSDFEELLIDKVSDALTRDQKKNLIRNLLQEMRRNGIVEAKGSRKAAKWVLADLQFIDKNNLEDLI